MTVIPNHLGDCEVISFHAGPPSAVSGQVPHRETKSVVVGWRIGDGAAQPVTVAPLDAQDFHILRVGRDYFGLGEHLGVAYASYRDAVEPMYRKDLSIPPSVGTKSPHGGDLPEPPRRPPLGPRAASPRHPRESVP